MTSHSQIRGSFIRDYADTHRNYMRRGWDLIQRRDEEHRALNKAYGYVEKDGIIPIGCKSHVDLDYKRKYDEVEARFREPYNRGLPDLYDWCKREGISIFECLWIDNIDTDHLDILASESQQRPDWQMNYVARKAELLVQKLKAAHSVGEIKRLIEMEVRNHGYAVARCRKMLDIKPWQFGKQKTLLEYRRDWKTALNNAFYSMAAR